MDLNLPWRTSSYSTAQGGNCVQVAPTPHTIAVRDSTDPHGPILTLTPHAWATFLTQVKHGHHTT
jgi:hypothetical protein